MTSFILGENVYDITEGHYTVNMDIKISIEIFQRCLGRWLLLLNVGLVYDKSILISCMILGLSQPTMACITKTRVGLGAAVQRMWEILQMCSPGF